VRIHSSSFLYIIDELIILALSGAIL